MGSTDLSGLPISEAAVLPVYPLVHSLQSLYVQKPNVNPILCGKVHNFFVFITKLIQNKCCSIGSLG